MTEETDATPGVALVAYVLTHAMLKAFIAKGLLPPGEARELIDDAILTLERLHGAVTFEQPLLEAARKDLESTLSMLPKSPD